MASVHLLLKIRAVTIHCAINRFQHLPPYAQVLDMHYAGMRAQGCEQGNDLVGLLQIQIRMLTARTDANGQTQTLHAFGQHHARFFIPEGNFQMIALFRIGHGASAQKHAAQKRAHATAAGERQPGCGCFERIGSVFVFFHHAQGTQQHGGLNGAQREHAFALAAEARAGNIMNLCGDV